MKELLKNKKLIIIISCIIGVLLIGLIWLIFKDDEEQTAVSREKRTETYTMFVRINPLVKLVFEEVYEECTDKDGKTVICSSVKSEVLKYELINDDSKEIYKELDFTGQELFDVLLTLCDTARDNDIGFESLEITTDSENVDYETIKEYIKNESKYKTEYTVYVNFEEYIDENNIIDATPGEYNVIFDTDGGTEIAKQTIKENDYVIKPNNPTKEGYEFVEWQLNGEKYDFESPITNNITLKATWKKITEEKTTTKQQTTKKTSSTTTKVTKTTEKTTTKTTKPESNITSTATNINLNDNLFVIEVSVGTYCGHYFFAKNADTVLKDYMSGNSINVKDYNKVSDQLIYDNEAATNAYNKINSLKNKKVPGVGEIYVSLENNELSYSYDFMYFEEMYGDLRTDFYKLNKDFRDSEDNALKDGIYAWGECGDMGMQSFLTEELCDKYNLTCSRW